MPRFDHHCPWVGNTVGYKNHPIFLIYTLSVFVTLIFMVNVELKFLSDQHRGGQQAVEGLAAYPFVTLSIAIGCFFSLFTVCLFTSHVYASVLGNLTTNELMNKRRYSHFIDRATGMPLKRSPFHRGGLANIRMFFHITAADEALCVQCDEPEVEMAA